MIMNFVTTMISLYNGFYLFHLSRAVNSNRLIFDTSEVEIHQYLIVSFFIVAVFLTLYERKLFLIQRTGKVQTSMQIHTVQSARFLLFVKYKC